MVDWSGQVCVITGAASGIGAGLVRHSCALGMQVVAADVDEAGLALLAEQGERRRWMLSTWSVDVSDAEAVEQLARQVFDRHGQVNLLFNNAGVLVDGKSWERPLSAWRWSLDVNVMGVVHGLRSFVPRMLGQGAPGRVINTSSIGGLMGGGPFMGPYQSSKHAVTALTETLYQELALEAAPVTASVLCPAEVATGIWESDRLRPAEERNVLGSAAEQQFRTSVAGGVAAGTSPDDFAAQVLAAIEADQFWIMPDTAFLPVFEQRCRDIVQGSTPAPLGHTDP